MLSLRGKSRGAVPSDDERIACAIKRQQTAARIE